jgi:uncharacterized protein (DUF58 family)
MALVLLSLVALGLRIENNMLIAVSALLSAVFFFSVLWGAASFSGTRVSITVQSPVFAQEANRVGLTLEGNQSMPSIVLSYRESSSSLPPLQAISGASGASAHLQVLWQPGARGWQSISPVRLQSSFPLNMVRMWTLLKSTPILVAPAPVTVAELYGLPGMEALQGRLGEFQDDTPTELSAASPGDSPARILWKQHARTGALLKRVKAIDQQSNRLELSYARYAHLGHERALSILCGALRACVSVGLQWRLLVAGCDIDSSMPGAYRRATDALALA